MYFGYMNVMKLEPFNFKDNKATILLCLFTLLIVGLLFSRALLSISTVFLLPFCLMQKPSKKLLFAFGLILLPVIFSFFWSNDKLLWFNSVHVKLALPIIAFSILATRLTTKNVVSYILMLNVLITIACMASYVNFYINKTEILKGYLQAQVMWVPMDTDHIRFSWFVVLSGVLLLWQIQVGVSRKIKLFAIELLVFNTIFLHFLAAKTGLLCLYIFIALQFVELVFIKKKLAMALGLMFLAATIIVIAYYTIPTLQNRVQYFLYDFNNYSNNIFEQNSSDGNRILSLQAGWYIFTHHFMGGVGFGDIGFAVQQWHQQFHPMSSLNERFLPTNQFLIYACGTGIFGLIAFIIGLFYLLRFITIKNMFSISITVLLIIPLITDDSLEGQNGACIMGIIIGLTAYLSKQKKRLLALQMQ